MAAVPREVEAFRVRYRAEQVAPWYRGWVHFAFTSVGSLAVIAFAVSRVHGVRPLEWLTIPATFLFANTAEYFGHKGPMHHPTRGRGAHGGAGEGGNVLFRRHAREHHRFFTHDAMAYDSSRDFKMVLFPPEMLLFFLGVVATPIGAVLFVVASADVAWLYVATAMSYFLAYEWLHFAYHLDETHWLGGSPLLRALRRHHRTHHDQALMSRWNFNITFPICDALFGTTFGPRSPPPAPSPSSPPSPPARDAHDTPPQ